MKNIAIEEKELNERQFEISICGRYGYIDQWSECPFLLNEHGAETFCTLFKTVKRKPRKLKIYGLDALRCRECKNN